jgi:hypothetical protein
VGDEDLVNGDDDGDDEDLAVVILKVLGRDNLVINEGLGLLHSVSDLDQKDQVTSALNALYSVEEIRFVPDDESNLEVIRVTCQHRVRSGVINVPDPIIFTMDISEIQESGQFYL